MDSTFLVGGGGGGGWRRPPPPPLQILDPSLLYSIKPVAYKYIAILGIQFAYIRCCCVAGQTSGKLSVCQQRG